MQSTALSYFSRMTDCTTFGELATVETVRRGVLTARTLAGVVDGAVWAQGFLDLHRPDAVRILDWTHAVGYLAEAACAVFGAETDGMISWLAAQREALYTGDPQVVLDTLRALREALAAQAGDGPPPPAHAVVSESFAYLDSRTDQIRYAYFCAQGYPIGSGTVESANKLVVEARLKGAGMHGAPTHVNPLLALRSMTCSDRWAEAWPHLVVQWRTDTQEQALQRRRARQAAAQEPAPCPPAPCTPTARSAATGAPTSRCRVQTRPAASRTDPPLAPPVPRRPAAPFQSPPGNLTDTLCTVEQIRRLKRRIAGAYEYRRRDEA